MRKFLLVLGELFIASPVGLATQILNLAGVLMSVFNLTHWIYFGSAYTFLVEKVIMDRFDCRRFVLGCKSKIFLLVNRKTVCNSEAQRQLTLSYCKREFIILTMWLAICYVLLAVAILAHLFEAL